MKEQVKKKLNKLKTFTLLKYHSFKTIQAKKAIFEPFT